MKGRPIEAENRDTEESSGGVSVDHNYPTKLSWIRWIANEWQIILFNNHCFFIKKSLKDISKMYVYVSWWIETKRMAFQEGSAWNLGKTQSL